MSGRARALFTLGTSLAVTATAISYSHYSQTRDKQEMKKGVLRDKERIRLKRLEKKKKAELVNGENDEKVKGR